MLSEMLLPHGYNTFLVGKWHLSPPEHETPAGPYDRWPLGRGFERFYGFLGGDTNQWYPELVYDNHSVEQPAQPEDGYHLSADLADRAIEFIQDAHVNAPDKPFYLHYCTGAGHAPHHVAKEWADKYKGKFDAGWDEYRKVVHQRQLEMGIIPAGTELSAHDPDVPEWDTLPEDARKVFARMMEVYAGFVSYTDHEFGRVVSFLEEIGELDNTLFLLISDNGASSEGGPVGSLNEMMFFNGVPESIEENLERIDELGGPNVFNHYAWGWTNAGNTPFRRWKRETYRGGTTDPCIVSWPAKITARGEIRTQYGHIIDLVPTVLDALGITATGHHPWCHPGTDRGRELRPHLQRRRGCRPVTTPSTSRCSVTGPSTTTDGARSAPGPARASPRPRRRAATTAARSTARCSPTSKPTTGSCTTSPPTMPRPTTWRPTTATR